MIERAVIVSPGEIIRAEHLPAPLGPAPAATPSAEGGVLLPVGTNLEEAERQLILRTLAHTGNNKTRAAEILGVSLKILHNKLNKYNA